MRRDVQGNQRRVLIPQRGDHLWGPYVQQRKRYIGRYLRRSRELSRLFDDCVRAVCVWSAVLLEDV